LRSWSDEDLHQVAILIRWLGDDLVENAERSVEGEAQNRQDTVSHSGGPAGGGLMQEWRRDK
jgi:hypothetical protein